MTVSKEYNKHIYEGNGLTRDWPYDFDLPITAAGTPDTSLIHVFRTNLRGEVTEVTAFSVDAETGTLTYPTSGSPLESGEKLTILRLLDVRQQFFDPSNQANLYPETLEDNTDRLVMMIQQIDEEVGRAVTMGEGYEGEEVTAEGLLEARDIAISAAETAEGYAAQLPAIADELGVNLVTDEADLRAKITAIGASDATLVIATSIPLAEDLTIPSNIALAFKYTGSLEPAVTKTLTVNGPVDAGLWQIFGGEGTVAGAPVVPYVYPEWFGAIGDGVADDYTPCQKALAFPSVEFPAGKTYRIVNATYAAGADMFEQRADAVANNTLYPLTAALDGQRIVVNGTIQATSELGDLLQVSGDGATVTGTGKIEGNGVVNDYNAGAGGAIPANQWYASLLKITGDAVSVSGLFFGESSTVAIHTTGAETKITENTITGGLAAHGSGTVLFGIYLDTGADRSLVSSNTVTANDDGKAMYDGVFGLANECVITGNAFSSLLEHGVYTYGTKNVITNNIMTGILTASAIQGIVTPYTIIQGNIFQSCYGSIGLNGATGSVIQGNTIIDCKLSGVSLRTYVGATVETAAQRDIVIEGNIIECTGNQPPIDIAISEGLSNFIISNNSIRYPGTDSWDSGAIRLTALTTWEGRYVEQGVISGNTVSGAPSSIIVCTRCKDCCISNNLFKNPNTAVAANFAILVNDTCERLSFTENTFVDTQGKTTGFLYAYSGATSIAVHNNSMTGLSGASGMFITAREPSYRNRINGAGAVGIFTATGSASQEVTNAQCANDYYQAVALTPLNANAIAMQKSANAFYPVVSNGKFTLYTSDTNAATTGAKFMYEIIHDSF